MKTRDQAIIALTPAADHSEKEGYFVVISSGEAAVTSSATTVPVGVIVDGADTDGVDTVALMNFGGTVRVKVAGSVTAGNLLQIRTDGAVEADDASGARTLVARALEDGVATELVDAALIGPIVYAS